MNVNKLMQYYRCDAATAHLYVHLRLSGYPRPTALQKAGLA